MTIKIDHTNNSLSSDNGVITINQTGAITLPVGSTAQQPLIPSVGMTRMNNDGTGMMEYWNGSAWYKVVANPTGALDDLTPLTLAQALL